MWLDTTRRERFWRGLALALLIILLWQTGNSALKPVNPLVVDYSKPIVDAARPDDPAGPAG
jgi:hypothetical protein